MLITGSVLGLAHERRDAWFSHLDYIVFASSGTLPFYLLEDEVSFGMAQELNKNCS